MSTCAYDLCRLITSVILEATSQSGPQTTAAPHPSPLPTPNSQTLASWIWTITGLFSFHHSVISRISSNGVMEYVTLDDGLVFTLMIPGGSVHIACTPRTLPSASLSRAPGFQVWWTECVTVHPQRDMGCWQVGLLQVTPLHVGLQCFVRMWVSLALHSVPWSAAAGWCSQCVLFVFKKVSHYFPESWPTSHQRPPDTHTTQDALCVSLTDTPGSSRPVT